MKNWFSLSLGLAGLTLFSAAAWAADVDSAKQAFFEKIGANDSVHIRWLSFNGGTLRPLLFGRFNLLMEPVITRDGWQASCWPHECFNSSESIRREAFPDIEIRALPLGEIVLPGAQLREIVDKQGPDEQDLSNSNPSPFKISIDLMDDRTFLEFGVVNIFSTADIDVAELASAPDQELSYTLTREGASAEIQVQLVHGN